MWWVALLGCSSTAPVPPRAAGAETSGAGIDTRGVEGFFPLEVAVAPDWQATKGIAVAPDVLRSVQARTVKLVLDGGPREALEHELAEREAVACAPGARPWNASACAGLERRSCEGERCTYDHFGNCSGFLVEEGALYTAAHCLVGVELATSYALTTDGRRLELGEHRAAKREFEHHWVALEEADPVDVARIAVDTGPLEPWSVAGVPGVGQPVFIHGFPRVVGRSAQAREAAGYDRIQGTPTYSFGKVVHANPDGLPLCSTDGTQEGWDLAAPCGAATLERDGGPAYTGPITARPFLGSWDTCNGYSGAPVFDVTGRLVGINSTIVSPHSPQERYSSALRTVATPAEHALSLLRPRHEARGSGTGG